MHIFASSFLNIKVVNSIPTFPGIICPVNNNNNKKTCCHSVHSHMLLSYMTTLQSSLATYHPVNMPRVETRLSVCFFFFFSMLRIELL